MVRSFLNTGVLIAAARSAGRDRELARRLLEEPDRVFFTSPFIHLERSFYEKYFRAAGRFEDLDKIAAVAQAEATKACLAAMDAPHLAAAHLSRASEFS